MPVMPAEIVKLIRKRCWIALDRPSASSLRPNMTFFRLYVCGKGKFTSK